MIETIENVDTDMQLSIEGSDYADLAHVAGTVTHRAIHNFGFTTENFCNWRWHVKNQIRTAREASPFIRLSNNEQTGFDRAGERFIAGISPYSMMLMRPEESAADHCPIRRQVIPRGEEWEDPIGIKDPLEEVAHSPVPEVVHVYPDRVAFCVAQLCPVYCRYCFRKRRDDQEGLHFNRRIIDRGVAYIRSMPAIRDVLITGGDPFIASDGAIEQLLQKLRSIPHVEIIRFGTRTPVALPYRVTRNLAAIIKRYHPVWLNTHFNAPEELTPEAVRATEILADAGIPVGNQSVLLQGVNDDINRLLPLLRGLLKMRVRPYYLFHPHRIEGTEHLRVSIKRGLDLMRQLRGNITGFGIPVYALDTPSGKIPLGPNHILAEDGRDLIIEGIRGGEIWREPAVLEGSLL